MSEVQTVNPADEAIYTIHVWEKMLLQDQVEVNSDEIYITLKILYDPCYISAVNVTTSANFNYNFVYMISPKTIDIPQSYDMPYYTDFVSNLG
jgi:hypothetical protein